MMLHFVGKVVAEGSAEAPAAATQAAALAAQEVRTRALVKEPRHARPLIPPPAAVQPQPRAHSHPPLHPQPRAQQVLVKEHARLLKPEVFATLPDERMELWLAPGNSEMAVAQNTIAMRRSARPRPKCSGARLRPRPAPHPLSSVPHPLPLGLSLSPSPPAPRAPPLRSLTHQVDLPTARGRGQSRAAHRGRVRLRASDTAAGAHGRRIAERAAQRGGPAAGRCREGEHHVPGRGSRRV